MAFRQTTFMPTQSQQFDYPGAKQTNQVNMPHMEEQLAREMARMKMEREKQQREVSKICDGSDELKELQARIKAAYLNKERAAQMTENQFRKQADIVSSNKPNRFRNKMPQLTQKCCEPKKRVKP